MLEWCARTCPFWGLLWRACSELFVTWRGWLQTCLWIVRYNSQDATVLCYTLQFVQRYQAEMLSHGAMRVYENSSSCKRQQHVDPWTTCCRARRRDSSQLKMEWLVDQKLILYRASWCAASDLVWTRWHKIWQGLDSELWSSQVWTALRHSSRDASWRL